MSPDQIERGVSAVAEKLYAENLVGIPAAKRREMWAWLPPAMRRQWIERAREYVQIFLEAAQ